MTGVSADTQTVRDALAARALACRKAGAVFFDLPKVAQDALGGIAAELDAAVERLVVLQHERDEARAEAASRARERMETVADWERYGLEQSERVRVLEAALRGLVSLDEAANQVRRQYAQGGVFGVGVIAAVDVCDKLYHRAKAARRLIGEAALSGGGTDATPAHPETQT